MFSDLKIDIKQIAKTYNTKLVLQELNYDKLPKPPPFNFHLSIPSDIEPLTVSELQKRDIATEWAVHIRKTYAEAEANKLSMKSFRMAEKGCRSRVEKLQREEIEMIKVLRQELEVKQKRMERLNQIGYQLQTVREQLKKVREELVDIEVKRVSTSSVASNKGIITSFLKFMKSLLPF